MHTRRRTFLAAGVGAALLVACGGSGKSDDEPASALADEREDAARLRGERGRRGHLSKVTPSMVRPVDAPERPDSGRLMVQAGDALGERRKPPDVDHRRRVDKRNVAEDDSRRRPRRRR